MLGFVVCPVLQCDPIKQKSAQRNIGVAVNLVVFKKDGVKTVVETGRFVDDVLHVQ